ncbi:DNA replication protein, partial [Frankliniella fusca]
RAVGEGARVSAFVLLLRSGPERHAQSGRSRSLTPQKKIPSVINRKDTFSHSNVHVGILSAKTPSPMKFKCPSSSPIKKAIVRPTSDSKSETCERKFDESIADFDLKGKPPTSLTSQETAACPIYHQSGRSRSLTPQKKIPSVINRKDTFSHSNVHVGILSAKTPSPMKFKCPSSSPIKKAIVRPTSDSKSETCERKFDESIADFDLKGKPPTSLTSQETAACPIYHQSGRSRSLTPQKKIPSVINRK